MNGFAKQFENLTTEHLLERRALGHDGLSDEAHRAIEVVLAKRGVLPPPIPERAIFLGDQRTAPRRANSIRTVFFVVAVLIGVAIVKQLAGAVPSILFAVLIATSYAFDWLRRRAMSAQERSAFDALRIVERDGLSDLMQASASGDIQRVDELLSYGAPVNQASLNGGTALMFAAKGGHAEVVRRLMEAGADADVRTDKGRSALDFAKAAGHEKVVALLNAKSPAGL